MSDINLPKLDWRVVLNLATPPDRRGWGRVRAAQLHDMGKSLRLAAWGQALAALLLVAVVQHQVPNAMLALWLCALALLMLITVNVMNEWRQRNLSSVPRKAIDRATYYSLFFGLLWAVPAGYMFPMVDHPQQLAICLVTVGMMAGATFVFATVPPAAGTFVFVMGAATSNMLFDFELPVMKLAGPLYLAALSAVMLSNGRSFMQRRCIELALEERTETVSLLLREYEDSDADWLWQTNSRLCFQNVSQRFARALGRRADELEGQSILALIPHGRAGGRATPPIVQCLHKRAPFSEMVVPIAGSEGVKAIELSARPRFNAQGRFLGYRGVGSDVTEARKATDRIEHMARHDALTALPNRLQLTDELGHALTRARDEGGQCAILLIDLDRFKSINDSLGHVAGDHLLQQVSSRFAPLLKPGMTLGRLGGDEFALIVPRAEDRDLVSKLGLAMVECLKEPFDYNDQHLFVGASIGIALGPIDGGSVEELIRNADLALYRAKDAGGNGLCFYEPTLHAEAEERRRIELALRTAIDSSEFGIVYQPLVDCMSGRIQGFEALLRWTNPIMGEITPARFIPIAEETGLIAKIGEWVLRNACAAAAAWPEEVRLSVNVSPRQLQDDSFILTLLSALSRAGLDPQRLELEITETVFLNVTPAMQRILQQIRGLGVALAMDDFGTGYSSLGYLREADFDTLKVDRSFIKGMRSDDPESGAIVKAVVALAGSLGMKTVAEGVETEEQLAMIRALGCDRVQGFVISEPVGQEEARDLLGRYSYHAAA